MAGRPNGAVTEKLFSNHTQAAADTTLRRFSVCGARSVVVIWKADSGTPTMTIGAYVHEESARDTTLTNSGLGSEIRGATVVAGQSNYIFVDGEAILSASDIPLGIRELDVQAAGAVVNLDVITIVMY